MVEKYLIEHCAPTLASLKAANLFNYPFEDPERLNRQIEVWNGRLQKSGVRLCLLRQNEHNALIYVYRVKSLQKILSNSETARFLQQYGYSGVRPDQAIEKMQKRLKNMEAGFPHEIGIFLGYPLEDVIGFIQNAGQNCKCCGCWKVYCNECEAERTFARYKKCSEIYRRLWNQGRTVMQLTVAA